MFGTNRGETSHRATCLCGSMELSSSPAVTGSPWAAQPSWSRPGLGTQIKGPCVGEDKQPVREGGGQVEPGGGCWCLSLSLASPANPSQEVALQLVPWASQGACCQPLWPQPRRAGGTAPSTAPAAPWLLCQLCTASSPREGSSCLLQTIIQTPINGGEPGDLFYKGQTDVNSFSTKISAPLPSSQRL